MPMIVTPMNTTIASAKVTMMWLVTVKLHGTSPKQVGEQDEHEQREDERHERPRPMPGVGVDHVDDKLVEHFGDRLHASRYQRRVARAQHDQRGDREDDDRHQQRRVRIGNIDPADMQRDEPMDLELLQRMELHRDAIPRLVPFVLGASLPRRPGRARRR